MWGGYSNFYSFSGGGGSAMQLRMSNSDYNKYCRNIINNFVISYRISGPLNGDGGGHNNDGGSYNLVVMFSGAKFSGDGTSETLESMAEELRGNGAVVYTVGPDFNQSDNTNAMEYSAFIQLHAKQFPGAKVFLYGYSYGGVIVNEVAKRLDVIGIPVEYMAIVDGAKGTASNSINRTITGNVKYADNFYQTSSEFLTGSHGAPYTGINTVNNYRMGYSHSAMDEVTRNAVITMMRAFMNYNR